MNSENEKKALLHESLTFLVESANINNGKLTVSEIQETLKDIIEDEAVYTLVYDYLIENKIEIEGYEKPVLNIDAATSNKTSDNIVDDTNTPISDKEATFIKMYLDELNEIENYSSDRELELLEAFISNSDDKSLVNELTTANLSLVTTLTNEYKNKGVMESDLIQEGNLGLMEGIMTYNKDANLDTFHNYLITTIKNALNDAVVEQNSSNRINNHAADRANEIDRASINLSKELDRTPTLEELAKYLSLPEDEVERVMKMSLNALTIDNSDIEENPDT